MTVRPRHSARLLDRALTAVQARLQRKPKAAPLIIVRPDRLQLLLWTLGTAGFCLTLFMIIDGLQHSLPLLTTGGFAFAAALTIVMIKFGGTDRQIIVDNLDQQAKDRRP